MVETKKPDIFDTVIELDITGKWVFWRGLWPFRVLTSTKCLENHEAD